MDKIVRVAVDKLMPWPGNPRRGNHEAIRESLREHGVYKPLLVQKSSGRIFAGNNTWEVARELGIAELEVIYKDYDDGKCKRVMLADNRTSDLSGYDDDALTSLLRELDGNYAGTGWTAEDAEAKFLSGLADGTPDVSVLIPVDEDFLVLDELPGTGAHWAELPQQEAARAERQAAQVPHAAAGTREIVLVYPEAEHVEMIRMLESLRRALGGEVRIPQIVQRLVREAVQKLADV